MPMRPMFSLGVLVLAGCQPVERVADSLMGVTRDVVILSDTPIQFGERPVVVTGARPLSVVGQQASVCLVLRSGLPLGPQTSMDEAYDAALSGTEFTATFFFKDGQRTEATCLGQSWRKRGVTGPREELSACVQGGCRQALPVGTQVEKIAIRATKPIRVLGAYWESSNALDGVRP